MAGLLKRAKALQSTVYAGGAHEETYGGEASQMHGECWDSRQRLGVGLTRRPNSWRSSVLWVLMHE